MLHWACSEGATQVMKLILDSKYGPQLARTVDFAVQTPLEVRVDLAVTLLCLCLVCERTNGYSESLQSK